VKTVYSHYKYLQWHSYRLMIMIQVYSVSWNVIIRSYSLSQVTKIVIWSNHKSNHRNSNQIQIKLKVSKSNIFTQIRSPNVIQSWFKSNHDLILPITDSLSCQRPSVFREYLYVRSQRQVVEFHLERDRWTMCIQQTNDVKTCPSRAVLVWVCVCVCVNTGAGKLVLITCRRRQGVYRGWLMSLRSEARGMGSWARWDSVMGDCRPTHPPIPPVYSSAGSS